MQNKKENKKVFECCTACVHEPAEILFDCKNCIKHIAREIPPELKSIIKLHFK